MEGDKERKRGVSLRAHAMPCHHICLQTKAVTLRETKRKRESLMWKIMLFYHFKLSSQPSLLSLLACVGFDTNYWSIGVRENIEKHHCMSTAGCLSNHSLIMTMPFDHNAFAFLCFTLPPIIVSHTKIHASSSSYYVFFQLANKNQLGFFIVFEHGLIYLYWYLKFFR